MSTYLFIDGGYLRSKFAAYTKRYYNLESLPDLAGLYEAMSGQHGPTRHDIEKIFYYDCVPESNPAASPSSSHSTTVRIDEQYVSEIRAKPRWHVREGRLVGERARGLRQKRVDILLTVEMLSHAFAKNMSRAILIAGDDDFTPLVNELLRHGIFVELWSDPLAPAQHLADSADEFRPMRIWFYWRLMPPEERTKHPFPDFHGTTLLPPDDLVVRCGVSRSGLPIMICKTSDLYHFVSQQDLTKRSHARCADRYVLETLIADEFQNHELTPKRWEDV